ncbi:MAG: di-heme oxidoredictase family protein [Pseudomonadota bacterium]
MSASKVLTACRLFSNSPSRAVRLSLFLPALAAVSVHAEQPLDVASGKALFEKIWVTAPSSTQASDGLGPYYDARACSACHANGDQGEFPAALVLSIDDPVYGKQLQRHAVAGLPAEGQFTVITGVQGDTALPTVAAELSALQYGELQQQGSLRLPPALHGIAGFDRVTTAVLQQWADPDDANNDGISGRVSGRYGWKATGTTLAEQIDKAFSIDMGLGSTRLASPHGDCTDSQSVCLQRPAGAATGEPEVPVVVGPLIASYLQSLRPLTSTTPAGSDEFAALGCGACHRPSLPAGDAELHAFTDLLLHDLGPGLAANLPEPTDLTQARPAEWRTAPLWGLSRRTRYLHDGRADTLDAAIRWHAGEAESSRNAYNDATNLQRERLLAFLRAL